MKDLQLITFYGPLTKLAFSTWADNVTTWDNFRESDNFVPLRSPSNSTGVSISVSRGVFQCESVSCV